VAAGAVALLVVLGGAACAITETEELGRRVDAEAEASQADAQLTGCADDPASTTASVAITNGSSRPSTYIVDVRFALADGGERTGHAFVDALAPGASVDADVVGPADAGCAVVHVERLAS
jgi:hypothetical protein